MSKLDKLTAMQNQVLVQMITEPDISNNFSTGLKKAISKVGFVAVCSLAMFSSNMAHADDTLRAMLGVSAISGLLSSNSRAEGVPSECNIQGVNGFKVGGAMAAGSLLANQFGGGKGKTLLTVGGGLATGYIMSNSEKNRIEQEKAECMRRIEAAQARNAGVNPNYGAPNYIPNPQVSTPVVLYTFTSPRVPGQTIVTMDSSPGIMALKGVRDGSLDPNSDPEVINALTKAEQGVKSAYNDYNAANEEYIRITNGTPDNNKSARYAVSSYEIKQAERTINYNKQRVQEAATKVNVTYSTWAKERAFTAAVFDNAAIDGYSLANYRNDLVYFQPPQNATVACQCILPNRYSTVPKTLTVDR